MGTPSIEQARFRQVLGHFCSGVTVVTGLHGGKPVGFTAQSFTSVSLDPPLVLVCPAESSTTWPHIEASGGFCANILAADQEAVSLAFAARGGADKFKGVGWSPAPRTGSPVLSGALAWVDCRIEQRYEAGDHLIVVGRVLDLGVEDREGPLLFYRSGYGGFGP